MAFRFGFAPTATSSNLCKIMAGKSVTTFAQASKSGSSKAGAIAASKRSLRPAKWVEQEPDPERYWIETKAPSCWELTIAPGCGTRLVA